MKIDEDAAGIPAYTAITGYIREAGSWKSSL
jgi:hypothetical protein